MSKIFNLFAVAFLLMSFERLDVIQEYFGGEEALLDLKDGQSIGQTFIAKHNNLSMIQLLETVDSKFKNKDKLIFHLRDYSEYRLGDGEDLVKLEFSGANIGTHKKIQLKFPPIPDSKNKKYYFYVENLGDPEFPDYPTDSVIKIGSAGQDYYKDGALIYNNKWLEGDLAFRTFYQVPPHKIFLESGRDFIIRFWQDKIFFFFYLSIPIILLFFIRRA